MMLRKLRHPRGARFLAVVAFGLAVAAGVAYAAIPDSGGVYTACRLNVTGTIRLIDPSLPSTSLLGHCTSVETQFVWNRQGNQGLAGAVGAQGPVGETGAQGATGPAGPAGSQGDTGPVGPQGPTGAAGASDLPPVGIFLPTQLVQGAILTCATTSNGVHGPTCTGAKLDGLDVGATSSSWNRICQTVTGSGWYDGTGQFLAGDPHFEWGSAWTLTSVLRSPTTSLTCNA